MIENNLRVTRVASVSVQLTSHELGDIVTRKDSYRPVDYVGEANTWLKATVEQVQTIGRITCDANCGLTCAGLNLMDTITPETDVDAELVARCDRPDCPDTGVKAAQLCFKAIVGSFEQL